VTRRVVQFRVGCDSALPLLLSLCGFSDPKVGAGNAIAQTTMVIYGSERKPGLLRLDGIRFAPWTPPDWLGENDSREDRALGWRECGDRSKL